MTIPFRPDPPDQQDQRQRAYLAQALREMFAGQRVAATDATRTSPTGRPKPPVSSFLPQPGVMRATPQGPAALPLPRGRAREVGRDGSDFIMGLTDASGTVMDAHEAAKAAQEGRFRNALGHALLAAAPVVSGTSVKAAGDKLADALRRSANPFHDIPEPPRVFHGSSTAFPHFELHPRRRDGNLWGIYFTEDAAEAGGRMAVDEAGKSYLQDGSGYAVTGRRLPELWDQAPAPNVRPARLAIRKPIDIDAAMEPDVARGIVANLPVPDAVKQDLLAEMADAEDAINGWQIYRWMEDAVEDHIDPRKMSAQAAIAEGMRRAGYDGFTFMERALDRRSPDHRVWGVWDRSQIRSPWGDWKNAAQFGALASVMAGGAALRRREEGPDK